MIGWTLTAFFGVFGMIQWIQGHFRKPQLRAIKASLVQFNAMCNDAADKGDAAKPDAMARFISDAAHMARGIEHQVDSMNGNLKFVSDRPQSPYRRIIGFIFPLAQSY